MVLALFAFATIPRLIVLPDMTSPYNYSMGIYNSAIIARQGPCDERVGSFSKTPWQSYSVYIFGQIIPPLSFLDSSVS